MPDLFLMPGTEDGSDGGYDQDSPGGPAENGAGPFPVLSLDNQPPASSSTTVAPAAGSDAAPSATPAPPPTPPPSVVATPDAAASPSRVIPAIPSPLPPPTPSPTPDSYASEAEDLDPEAGARAEEKARDHFRQLFTDDNYLRWTADDPAVGAAAAANPDPNSVQIRGADQAYLAFRLGVPTERLSGAAYTAQRDGYARAHFGRQGSVTDHEFFGLVRGEMQDEIEEEKAFGAVPEVIVSGWMEGLAGGHVPLSSEMMTRWRSQYPNLRLDAGEEARLMAAAQEAAQPVYDFLSKYGRQAKLAYDTLKNFTDGKTTQPDTEVLSGLATQLDGMPDEDRRQLYGYLGLYAQSQATTPEGKAAATKLWAKQFGESISRSITETTGAGELLGMQDEKTRQMEVLKRFQGGTAVPHEDSDLLAHLSAESLRFHVDDVEGQNFWLKHIAGKITPEERQKKIDRLESDLRTIQIVRELRAVAAGEIDPAREISKGWLGMAQKASYVAGSSLPYMAATVLQPEIGIPLVMGALSASETNRILLQNPRMPLDQARTMGMISAAAQTATMALTARLVVGRMPATAAFFKSLETPAVSLPGVFGRTALRTGISAIEAGLQAEIGLATPMVVDGLAKSMGADMPGYDFRKKLAEFLSPDTQVPALLNIALVVAVGSGLAGLKDIKQFREIRQDPAKLTAAFGIDAESARRVAEAPDDKQDAILREAMARVSPETNRKLGEEAQKAAERAQAMQTAPGLPTLNVWNLPDGTRYFSVEGKPGKEIYLTQDQDAALMAHGEALRHAEREKASVEAAPSTSEGQVEVNPAEGRPTGDEEKTAAGPGVESQPAKSDNQEADEVQSAQQDPEMSGVAEDSLPGDSSVATGQAAKADEGEKPQDAPTSGESSSGRRSADQKPGQRQAGSEKNSSAEDAPAVEVRGVQADKDGGTSPVKTGAENQDEASSINDKRRQTPGNTKERSLTNDASVATTEDKTSDDGEISFSLNSDDPIGHLVEYPQPNLGGLTENAEPVTPTEAGKAIDRLNADLEKRKKPPAWRARLVPEAEMHPVQQTDAAKLARMIAGIFKKRVVIFETEGKHAPVNGIAPNSKDLRGYTFLHNRAKRPHLLTIGHELWHHLTHSSPEFAGEVYDLLKSEIKDFDAINAAKSKYPLDKRLDEVIADFLGDSLADRKFWKRLEKKNPEAFLKFAVIAYDWLSKLIALLKLDGAKSYDHFKDIERAHDILAEAVSRFANSPDGVKGGFQIKGAKGWSRTDEKQSGKTFSGWNPSTKTVP